MLKTFIQRPVLSTVISIIIVVLGVLGLLTLPVEQYPDIAPPTVQISTMYNGANADVVLNSVIIPIEEQVNGVEGMTYMSSKASNNGMADITVFFDRNVNPDIAAVNVQNLVARATPLLPQEVVNVGVTVSKKQSSTILFMSLTSKNPDYDGRFIQNYADINIIPQIKRVQGVGDASVFGAQTYSMRIWLKPDVLAAYKMSTNEVLGALNDQNIEAAPGELGQNSNQAFQYTMKYAGKLKSEEEFGNIIIRSVNGQILRLKDVADVELGSLNYTVLSKTDKNESVVIAVNQTAGSNAQEVIENVKAVIDNESKFFPEGVEMVYMMDANQFLDESISKLIKTLLEAFILVFIVVFVFLQDFRSTLIPAIAVPVAIVGTFFFLQLFGFSINLLTLFALVLAIGIVVDDAIVVVEAVHAQLDAGEKDPMAATMKAMKEIAPAIVSITLVMSSVFIPVSFIGGTSGVFYKQFGLTLAVAIILSAVNALTLSPALCAIVLKPHENSHSELKGGFMKRFFYSFNIAFSQATMKYKSTLHFLGKRGHRWITVAIIIVSGAIFMGLKYIMPTGFVPQEDGGSVMGMIHLPAGSSLERADSLTLEIVDMARSIDAVENVANISGVSFMNGLGSPYGSVIIKLKDWSERDVTADELAALLKQKTDSIQNANFMFFASPTLQGFGLTAGVTISMQDRTGGDIMKFNEVTQDFIQKLQNDKRVMMVMVNFDPNFPQKQIDADIAKIKAAGLTLSEVMGTLQAYVGSMYISNFNLYGKQYRIMVQAHPEYRKKLEDLSGLFVKTSTGEMAPVTEFITLTDVTGPQSLTRFNMFSSMDITIIPNLMEQYNTGDGIEAVKEYAAQLPAGYTYEYSGMTKEEVSSGNETILIFILCLVFVYLLLAALYESYLIPLAVIFSLPVGIAGVYIFVFGAMMMGTGIMDNIYVQIALIMLIGLLAKNAILIVEYAVQRRQRGMSIVDAAVNGAVARLRPILMTSFAFIFGLLPLALSSGAGSVGNKSIGISAIGGMFIGTMIGILVIPTLYIVFQNLEEKLTGKGKHKKQEN